MHRNIFFLLAVLFLFVHTTYAQQNKHHTTISHGGVVRADSTQKNIALVFTADEFGEGLSTIRQTLNEQKVRGSFFFTGRFYRNTAFKTHIEDLQKEDHYFGPHSNDHLLYCDWTKRDSLLVTKDSFEKDMALNLAAMKDLGLTIHTPHFFIPPYEWWNDSVAQWSMEKNLTVVSFTPGIRTNADYTWPDLGASYKSSEWIMNWLKETIAKTPSKLNGAIMLIHTGTDPRRKDKLYNRLEEIILMLKKAGYQFHRIDSLLRN